jgi:hypothetical protein
MGLECSPWLLYIHTTAGILGKLERETAALKTLSEVGRRAMPKGHSQPNNRQGKHEGTSLNQCDRSKKPILPHLLTSLPRGPPVPKDQMVNSCLACPPKGTGTPKAHMTPPTPCLRSSQLVRANGAIPT